MEEPVSKQRVAFYIRVSMDEHSDDERFQNPENQINPLKKYAESKGWVIVGEYIDKKSGKNANRPAFRRLFEDAAKGKFDIVMIWAFDRFSREGILATLSYLQQLKDRKIYVKSYQDLWLDTESPYADLMLAQMAWFAKFERERISERTKASVIRQKATGTYTGGKPKRCMVCGWQHSPKKPHIEPFNTKYLPLPVPTVEPTKTDLTPVPAQASEPSENSGSKPPLPITNETIESGQDEINREAS